MLALLRSATRAVLCFSAGALVALPTSATAQTGSNGSLLLQIDTPQNGAKVRAPFTVAGWVLDTASSNGTGIDVVHAWAIPNGGGPGIHLGSAVLGDSRPDVGGIFGPQFATSGYHLTARSFMPAGTYALQVFGRRTGALNFEVAAQVSIEVLSTTLTDLGPCVNGQVPTFTDNVWACGNGSGQWIEDGLHLKYIKGNVGINTSASPGERLHIGDGNILLEGGAQVAIKFKRDFTFEDGPSGPSPFPVFDFGRILQAGDGDPEVRLTYSDRDHQERSGCGQKGNQSIRNR